LPAFLCFIVAQQFAAHFRTYCAPVTNASRFLALRRIRQSFRRNGLTQRVFQAKYA